MNRLAFLSLLCWFSIGSALAQTPSLLDTLTVDRYLPLPKEGRPLDTAWKYQPGDNRAWASPTLDDRQWLPLNPTRSLNQLPRLPPQGIGWLRLHVPLDPSWQQQPLLLQMDQFCASEIYLNGRLVHRSGVVSADPNQVKLTNDLVAEPLSVVFKGPQVPVLAIRFALWPKRQRFNQQWNPYLLHAQLISLPQLLRQLQRQTEDDLLFSVGMGICLLLVLLHTAFFRFNPAQAANRYFAFYTLSLVVHFASRIYLHQLPVIEQVLYVNTLVMVALYSSFYWCLRALYTLFNQRPTLLYYGLWVAVPLLLLVDTFQLPGHLSQRVLATVVMVPQLLAILEQLRLIGQGLRAGRRGAGLIAGGFAVSFLLYGGNLLQHSMQTSVQVWGTPLLLLILLSPVVSISLYLAREFALDSQQLQVKLGQVEALSAQTLAQEQEKQQLLATQNERLEAQVDIRTAELKASQAQLIQKEKLASLGELTAGIAHEIQNPLNFVNNFSEVSGELVEELKEELAKGELEEASLLADDLASNLQKIHHHGGRASSIVKGMLEHSRTATGDVQPMDFNALVDEYLRLAYHGWRAKDKHFAGELVTHFDSTIGQINLVPQEMGRVLLNLFSNAFYAVRERHKQAASTYVPTVRVTTNKTAEGVQLCIADNGTGIPDSLKGKIFQPFFTTKPTGAGTGLGLSLSYDIVTKGHGGTLTVESEAGAGSTFTISLPPSTQSSVSA